MKLITDISKDQYDAFVANHPTKSHFMQSYTWGDVWEKRGNTPHYVGLYDGEEIVAAALLLERRMPLGLTYFYAPRGFVIDFQNFELVKQFTKELKIYLKKYHAIFLKIDPDVVYQVIGKSHYPDDTVIKYLKQLGYQHKGFNKGFEHNQPRYTFRIDLTPSLDEIKKRMHESTRKIINRNNPYELKVEIGDETDIKDFTELMQITEKRDDFMALPYEHYYDFYTILHREGMADLYTLRVDFDALLKNRQNLLSEKEAVLKKQKQPNKIKETEIQIEKIKKEIEEFQKMKKEYPNHLLISSIITVKYGNKVWTIHGGNHDILKNLGANYQVYYQILLDAKKDGYEVLDMYGTDGYDENRGIHLFKKRFGGDYLEFIGEFDLVLSPMLYSLYQCFIPIYRKFTDHQIQSRGE